MVKTMLYCSEQIAIPETFPNILKTYAKAAIRTQPYDLLRWSSAYFRCLANNVPPPVKKRLEKECQEGSLTKGYLKVLLDQVGKGYFISRRLLQKRWAALCLPEEELLKYLSLCRMLNWPQVHWLKLFAVMAGSLNETPLGTMNLICELLTDDVEGGRARIPIWMFRVCYTFVAELDCSEEQNFVNGRKKLTSGDLELEKPMEKMPQIISATSLRQAIFDECNERYNSDCQCNPEQYESEDKNTRRSQDHRKEPSPASSVSSGFEFAGQIVKPIDMLRKCNDFDSIILVLRETQGAVLHSYEGPAKLTHKQYEYAKQRDQEVVDAKERNAQLTEDTASILMFQEKLNILKEIGPPWSWLHSFAADGCMDKSYNFIEEQSIISDETPSESSDESFDFHKSKPSYNIERKDSKSNLTSSSSEHVSELLREKTSDEETFCEDPIDIVRSFLKEAESKGEVLGKDTPSVVTFLKKEQFSVLKGAGQSIKPVVDIDKIVETIQIAANRGITFETIDEMVDYIKEMKYKENLYLAPIKKDSEEELPVEEEGECEEEMSTDLGQPEETEMQDEAEIEDIHKRKQKKISTMDNTSLTEVEDTGMKFNDEEGQFEGEEEMEHDLTSPKQLDKIEKSAETIVKSTEEIEQEGSTASKDSIESKDENDEQQTATSAKELHPEETSYAPIDEIKTDEEKIPMPQIFAESGTIPEEFKMGPEGSCTILGLMAGNEEEAVEEETIPEEQSEISASGTVSGFGDVSDVSSKYVYSERTEYTQKRCLNAYTCPHSESSESLCSVSEGFCCTIPAYRGIGGVVSKKLIQDFLTYLKMRSRSQRGMIMPKNFKEEKCPAMIDNNC